MPGCRGRERARRGSERNCCGDRPPWDRRRGEPVRRRRRGRARRRDRRSLERRRSVRSCSPRISRLEVAWSARPRRTRRSRSSAPACRGRLADRQRRYLRPAGAVAAAGIHAGRHPAPLVRFSPAPSSAQRSLRPPMSAEGGTVLRIGGVPALERLSACALRQHGQGRGSRRCALSFSQPSPSRRRRRPLP